MKKFLITALALVVGVSVAMAGMGIDWSDGGGWCVELGGDIDNGPGVADNNDVLWQLIYAGENNAIDPVSDKAEDNYLSGDDQLLADRTIPAGGGDAADGTSWDGWLMYQGGPTTYEDLSWTKTAEGQYSGSYVYQRIFQGEPGPTAPYFETELFAFNSAYVGGGQAPDTFGYADGEGVAVTGGVPEPATMSLLGLGALAMVLRRKLRK